MVSGINSDISQLQILRATQAFRKASTLQNSKNSDDDTLQTEASDQSSQNEQSNSKTILEKSPLFKNLDNIDEIKEFASRMRKT